MVLQCMVMFKGVWILTLIWFVVCEHVEGEQKNEPIIAAPGDDVILPCRLDSEEDLQDYFLEWTKLEMNPDPTKRRFVYLYRSRRTMTRFMKESFIQRVSLNPDGLKRGDVTLKIRNVTFQDKGTYRCYIHGLDHRETVRLLVEPNGVRAPTMETSQFNISTPDPGGEQNNTMSSHMILALCIFLGVVLSSILCCLYLSEETTEKTFSGVKTSHLSKAALLVFKD